MRFPRWAYFYLPAFLTETALVINQLAEPIYALDRWHASPLALGMLGMGNGGGYALLAIAAGWLSDRTGRRGWMLLGTGSFIVLGFLLPLCRNQELFIALAAMQMTLLAFLWAPYMSLLSETTAPEQLSRTLSRYNISWCLGSTVGAALAGWVYDRISHAAPFYFSAGLVCVSFAIQLAGRPGPVIKAGEQTRMDRPRVMALTKQAWLALVGVFFVVSMLTYLFPKLALTPRYHMDATLITTLHGVRTAAMLAVFALMGVTTRWHFRQWPLNACFGMLLALMALMPLVPSGWVFLLPFAVFGVSTGIAYGLSAYYSMLSPVGRGAVVGTHETFLSSGQTFGPIFGGVVIWMTGDPAAPFWAGLLPIGALWLAAIRLAPRGLKS